MNGLWEPAADSTLRDEFFGFTNFTLLAILGLLVMIFIVRLLTMRFAPTVLRTIIRSEAIKSKTVQDSDKALGTAVGVGLAYFLVTVMIDDMSRVGSPVLMPDLAVSFLPSILQFIVAIAVVVWAFRLVNIVHDVVMMFDSDDQLDGTEKTLISALQSTLRFIIIFVGAVFVADSMGFDLTSLIAGLGISGLALALAARIPSRTFSAPSRCCSTDRSRSAIGSASVLQRRSHRDQPPHHPDSNLSRHHHHDAQRQPRQHPG